MAVAFGQIMSTGAKWGKQPATRASIALQRALPQDEKSSVSAKFMSSRRPYRGCFLLLAPLDSITHTGGIEKRSFFIPTHTLSRMLSKPEPQLDDHSRRATKIESYRYVF